MILDWTSGAYEQARGYYGPPAEGWNWSTAGTVVVLPDAGEPGAFVRGTRWDAVQGIHWGDVRGQHWIEVR